MGSHSYNQDELDKMMTEEDKRTIRKIVRDEINGALTAILLGMLFVCVVAGIGMRIIS